MLYQIKPKLFPYLDTHAYADGFLSEEETNKVLALPHWHQSGDAYIGGGSGGEINKEVRRTKISWIDPCENTKWLWDKISDAVGEINNRFFQFDLSGFYEPIQLGIYSSDDNGFYDWHIDSGITDSGAHRKLSFALLLSDPSEFEGGQLELKISNDQPIAVEQKKGRAWMFPSYTLHRVTPVTKGVRRSLVVWIGGPNFK